MVNSTPKHKVPTRVYIIARLQLSIARMYFVKVWLIYYIQFFFGMLHVYKSEVRVDLQNAGFDPAI